MDINHLLKSVQVELNYPEGFYLCNAIQGKVYRQLSPGDLIHPTELMMASFLKTAGAKLAQKVHYLTPSQKSVFKVSFLPLELISLYMAIEYNQELMSAYIKIEQAALKYSYLIDFSTINQNKPCQTSHSNKPQKTLTSKSSETGKK